MSFTENRVAWCVFYLIGFMEGLCLWLYLERFWWFFVLMQSGCWWPGNHFPDVEISRSRAGDANRLCLFWSGRAGWKGEGAGQSQRRAVSQGFSKLCLKCCHAVQPWVATRYLDVVASLHRSGCTASVAVRVLLLWWVKITAGRSYFLPKLCHGSTSRSEAKPAAPVAA